MGTDDLVLDRAQDAARALFVCAPGAGGHRDDRAMLATSAALRAIGLDVVRFNFNSRSRGSRGPDPMPELRERYDAVVSHVRNEAAGRPLILGGRSMGG